MRASRPRYPGEPGPRREERGREKEREKEKERVDYRDEEEVDDGVVTAGGSCKIKRRLLLC